MSQYLRFDSPIYNLQVFLRVISDKYTDIPKVLPDGVYGETTKAAVEAFQKKFSLNSTGITDNNTWNRIVDIYRQIQTKNTSPKWIRIYPENGLNNEDISYIPTIYVIQTMIAALSHRFSNIPMPTFNGVLDLSTVNAIKAIQILTGLNPDGNITKIFWDYLSVIYEVFISTDNVENAGLSD